MDQDQTNALLRQSWSTVAVDRAKLAKLFYRKLFQIAPETEALFDSDLNAQGRKLVATLAFIVDNLEDTKSLLSAVEDLAVRHVSYGVKPTQYDYVGAALIETFKELMGEKFDKETEKAWASAYLTLSSHMIQSAYP